MDQKEWYQESLPEKVYSDPVQEGVRIVLGRALVKTFDLIKFIFNEKTKTYVPELPLPFESCIKEVIEYVSNETAKHLYEWNKELEHLINLKSSSVSSAKTTIDKFRDTCARISSGFLARHLLNTLSTFKMGINSDSAGANLGASVCQLAAILSSLDKASKGELIDVNFPELIPRGNVETGSKNGHPHVSYVEYMTSSFEDREVTGGAQLYLDPVKFRKDHHDRKVREIMDKSLIGIDAPAPRPTRAHTFDFNLTHRGARLLDGECKISSSNEQEEAVLVFHSVDQLAYKDTALSMLTTNTSFKLFTSTQNPITGKIGTTFCETKKYKLGSLTDITIDTDANEDWLQNPPSFIVEERGRSVLREETDEEILSIWKSQRSEVRRFQHVIFQAIDWLTEAISYMNVKKVGRARTAAWHVGAKEPVFLSTTVADVTTRRQINDQDTFIYCRSTMEGERDQNEDAKMHDYLYKHYKAVADSDAKMSTELRELIKIGLEKHKRK